MDKGYILITGASSGIGYELAKLYAAQGRKLVLIARSLQPLIELQKQYGEQKIEIIQVDLSYLDNAKKVYRITQEKGLFIDMLINNAGIGLLGDFANTDLEREVTMINLNIQSLIILTKLYLPHMLQANYGYILNVSSIAAEMPGGPQMSVYYATKAFVTSFSQGLCYELKGSGVHVAILAPGPTLTNFVQTVTQQDDVALFNKLKFQTAEEVAKYAEKSLGKRKMLIIPGVLNKLMVYSSYFIPKSWVLFLVNHIQSLKK